MKRTVYRDRKTGRFVKAKARKRKVKEELTVSPHEVVIGRGKRGRFVKHETVRRHPDGRALERIRRATPTPNCEQSEETP